MIDPAGHARGLAAKARRAAELGMLLLENRLELVSLELREEKIVLVRAIVRALLAVQLTLASLILVCVTVVWLSPAEARGWVLLGCTAVFALFAVASLLALRQSFARMGRPFRRTIEELKRDRQSL